MRAAPAAPPAPPGAETVPTLMCRRDEDWMLDSFAKRPAPAQSTWAWAVVVPPEAVALAEAFPPLPPALRCAAADKGP